MKTRKNMQIQNAIELATSQSDLAVILERLSEIDKLKKILLDNEQIKLFNFTPKPLIKAVKEGGEGEDFSPLKKSMARNPKLKEMFDHENQVK